MDRGFGRGDAEVLSNKSVEHPQAEVVTENTVESLSPTQVPTTISGIEYLASYNWVDHKSSTILVLGWSQGIGRAVSVLTVPGAPPVSAPPPETRRFSEDSGDVFRDPNVPRYPKNHSEPAVRAVITIHPQFQTDPTDMVGCRNTVGNLILLCQVWREEL